MRKARLIIKFFTINKRFASLFSILAFRRIEVIRNPLNTKKTYTESDPFGSRIQTTK